MKTWVEFYKKSKTIFECRGGSKIFSRGGGGRIFKKFSKILTTFVFLGRPNWFFELSQSTVLPLLWQNFLRRRQSFEKTVKKAVFGQFWKRFQPPPPPPLNSPLFECEVFWLFLIKRKYKKNQHTYTSSINYFDH